MLKKSAQPALFRFRWFTCNCYEFGLPGGISFVVDPMLVDDDFEVEMPFKPIGFTARDLEGADYVFINHGHLDHIASLKDMYELYQPRILAHAATAAALSRNLDLPQTAFFPYDGNSSYDFGDFRLTTIPARHNGNRRPSERPFALDEKQFAETGFLGTLYNTNFILETKHHLRVGFCAGVFRKNEVEWNAWQGKGCNIFIRQLGGYLLRDDPQGLADEFMSTGASLLLPIHQEKFYDGALPQSLDEMTDQVNVILAERGYAGQMLNPQRGRWYDVNMAICREET